MEGRNETARSYRQDNFTLEILDCYKAADESGRMDMYMTYRELREQFERIETAGTA